MAMKWQNISLPIAQGLDTKTDSKALPPTKLANLENGVFTKGGSIVKRNGYDKMTDDILASTSGPTSARALHTVDNELLLVDDERLMSYAPAEEKWVDRGRFKSVVINTKTIAETDEQQGLADCATVDGVTVYAWEHNGTAVNMAIVNEDTGTVYFTGVYHFTLTKPRVVAVGSFIHVYGVQGTNIIRTIISPANVDAVVRDGFTKTVLITDLDGSPTFYDVCANGDSAYLVYRTTHVTLKLKISRYTSTGLPIRDQDFIENADNALTVIAEPNTGNVAVVWHNDGEGVKAMIVEGAILQTIFLEILDPVLTAADVVNIACAFKRDPYERPFVRVLDLLASGSRYASITTSTTTDSLAIYDDITIECWVKFKALPTSGNKMTFVSRDENTTGNKGYYFRLVNGTPDLLQFGCRDAAGNYVTASTPAAIGINRWYHLAVVHDKSAGEVVFYKDGAAIGSPTTGLTDTTSQASAADLRIGSENGTHTNYFDGQISEVRIWDAERSAAEILANVYTEITTTQSNPKGYWRFNGDFRDGSGNLMHLTNNTGLTAPFVDAVTAVFPGGFAHTTPFTAEETETLANDYPLHVFYETKVVVVNPGEDDDGDSIDYNHFVRQAVITNLGTVLTGAPFKIHAGLASKAWSDGNDVHVNLVHASTLQTTYYTYMDDGTLIAKMEPGLARGLVTEKHLPGVQNLGGGVHQWVGGYRKRIDTTDADLAGTATSTLVAIYTAPGLKRFLMKHQSPQSHEMVQVGRTAYFNGGQIWQYDGNQIVEAGLHNYPEDFTVVVGGGSGGALSYTSDKTYFYKVYLAWTNANGEKERSTTAASVKTNTTGAGQEATLTIQTIEHTNKSNTHFEVYRTEHTPGANSPFYKVSGDDPTTTTGDNRYIPNTTLSGATIVNTVTFVDALADSVIIGREVDYLNSGELDNIPPPAASIIAEGKDRIWLAGFEDTSQIQYSKQHFTGRAVDFHDGLMLTIPEDGGAITGLRVMANNLIVFKERAIYAITGDGPNNLGFGQFGPAQLISSDVGCKNQKSIVSTPLGMMFQSNKGIYIITKQYQVGYIGAEVEAYNGATITRASVALDRNQVVFLSSDSRTLLYDYHFKQWSTFTNHQGTSATYWNNLYCYGRTDGEVYKESTTNFSDAGARVQLRLETSWVALNTLQGFQRVRRAMVLGEFKSGHRLALDVSYDYEPLKRRLVFEPTTPTTFGDPQPDAFGDGTPFGSGTATDGMETQTYQFRAHLPKQKCQSIKFYFEDLARVGEYLAEGYEITELMLEVGTKRGTFKVADTRSI